MTADQREPDRETAVRGASKTLGELLDSDALAREALYEDAAFVDTRALFARVEGAFDRGGMPEVRREKRRRMLSIAARDLCGELSLEQVGRALADVADACLEVGLRAVDAPAGMAIIAMGKLGARELNYVSDIDIMFVADGDGTRATRSAEALLRSLGDVSPEGRPFLIDTNLRPEGRSGVLVRPLESYLEYYKRWAQPWEYQALIKARGSAGDPETGARLVDGTRALVFSRQVSSDRVASIRRMKQRVEEHAGRTTRSRSSSDRDDVKLGPGGIRDIEFSVQLLQLVHGGSDPRVRAPSTLDALQALVDGGYMAEEDGAGLAVAYRWLRAVEHRLQLWQERRVHHLPAHEEPRARLARVMGFKDSPVKSASERFDERHRGVLADVRSRFERLFYRPMIESLADPSASRLSPEALRERLRILGFRDVERASKTLAEVVSGTSRRAKLLRVLTPALLRYLAESPRPDDGLFSFLVLGEALRDRVDALNTLRDNPPAIQLLARVLGSGRLLGDLLAHVPEELHALASSEGVTGPKERERLVREAIASLEWRDPDHRLDGLRRFRRRETLRIAVADMARRADSRAVGSGLADLADACLAATLEGGRQPFAVIGMGKLGGRELNYSSDIDVMFVHDGEQADAEEIAEALLRTIGEVTPEGQAFRIDAGLRPEGKAGALARPLQGFVDYYERWASPWEYLALIKARFAAGDGNLGDRLVEATRRFAYPESVAPAALAEIRHLKVRMERERVPKSADARNHIKFGPGGLSDIEFAVQLLQLRHGHEMASLRVTNTLEALEASQRKGVLSEGDARRLKDAYTFLMALRNRLFFLHGRPVDVLPNRPEDVEAAGIAMGYHDQPRQELQEAYLRVTRRARKVAEPLIYG